MKKIAIFAGCALLLLVVAVLKEDYFEVVSEKKEIALQAKDPRTTLLFVGDIMLGRNVENLMLSKGSMYPFQYSHELLKSADAVVANLEGTILSPHTHTPSQSLRFSFASTTAKLLAQNNIKLVSLANNHAYDYGVKGYTETQTFLSKSGIISVGNPYAFDDSYTARMESSGVPLLFVAFNVTNPSFKTDKALAFVKNLERKPEEFLVVLVHGGEEYELHSNDRQKKFYRGLIDAGADAIVAHHPHVVQEIEVYKNKPIFYSLGNFVFDQYFSPDVEKELAIKLVLSKTKAEYTIIALKSVHSQTQLMSQSEAVTFLESVASRSEKSIQESVRQGVLSVNR